MKITCQHHVEISAVDARFQLRLSGLFRYFQEAAAAHAALAGQPMREMRERGRAWIIHKFAIEVTDYPAFGAQAEVQSWSRGARDFKAFRDFTVAVEGKSAAVAASIWVNLDVTANRVCRVTEAELAPYTQELERALEFDLERWRPDGKFVPTFELGISTRPCDFDANGHMNNAVYIDLLETALARHGHGAGRISRLLVQFDRGVPPDQESVSVSLQDAAREQILFKLSAGDTLFARGECTLAPPAAPSA